MGPRIMVDVKIEWHLGPKIMVDVKTGWHIGPKVMVDVKKKKKYGILVQKLW